MSYNWAAEKAQIVRNLVAAKKAEGGLLRERRRLLQEQGPILWQEISNQVQTLCEQFNAEYKEHTLQFTQTSTKSFRVRFSTDHLENDLIAEFEVNASPYALKWGYTEGNSKGGNFALSINDQTGKVQLGYVFIHATPVEIAKQMLDDLLRG